MAGWQLFCQCTRVDKKHLSFVFPFFVVYWSTKVLVPIIVISFVSLSHFYPSNSPCRVH